MIDFNEKKGFICDMDGVIYHGNRILPGVVEFIDWLKANDKGYLFLTNNSGCTPKELNQKLARMGLDVPEEHFYTSALATAAFIKEQSPGCSAYVIGEAGLLNALYDAGITMNDIKESDCNNKQRAIHMVERRRGCTHGRNPRFTPDGRKPNNSLDLNHRKTK